MFIKLMFKNIKFMFYFIFKNIKNIRNIIFMFYFTSKNIKTF